MNVDLIEVNPVTFAKALADKNRQRIMRACCCSWVSVGDLAEQIGLKQPTVSHHLAILREAGLVGVRHEGKTAMVAVFFPTNRIRFSKSY